MRSLHHQLVFYSATTRVTPADAGRYAAWLNAIEAALPNKKRQWLPSPPQHGSLSLAEAQRTAHVAEALLDAGGPGRATPSRTCSGSSRRATMRR